MKLKKNDPFMWQIFFRQEEAEEVAALLQFSKKSVERIRKMALIHSHNQAYGETQEIEGFSFYFCHTSQGPCMWPTIRSTVEPTGNQLELIEQKGLGYEKLRRRMTDYGRWLDGRV